MEVQQPSHESQQKQTISGNQAITKRQNNTMFRFTGEPCQFYKSHTVYSRWGVLLWSPVWLQTVLCDVSDCLEWCHLSPAALHKYIVKSAENVFKAVEKLKTQSIIYHLSINWK